jgi:hypothetical protein
VGDGAAYVVLEPARAPSPAPTGNDRCLSAEVVPCGGQARGQSALESPAPELRWWCASEAPSAHRARWYTFVVAR